MRSAGRYWKRRRHVRHSLGDGSGDQADPEAEQQQRRDQNDIAQVLGAHPAGTVEEPYPDT